MLHAFLTTNHEELVRRCKAKVVERASTSTIEALETSGEPKYGVGLLLGQLVDTLRSEATGEPESEPAKLPPSIGSTAARHGTELLRNGATVEQVVHDYGDLCQAVTELAHDTNTPITVDEFHTFNRCLDNAIAGAVTGFGGMRDRRISEESAHTMNERLGFLAHELRNALTSATFAFQAIKRGHAPAGGATGAVLERSLVALRDLVDRSLADVRLTEELQIRREPFSIRELIDDLRITAELEASSRGLTLKVPPVDAGLRVDADRQMVSAAVANLLQNALKFTRPGGYVLLAAHAVGDRVLIDVEDQCGGLPDGKTEELFHSFAQRGSDRTGLGLGLSISRRGVEANGGAIHVRNLPGKGCVFTIELPRRDHTT